MVWTILIAVVVYIIFKFVSDNNKQASIIAKQGGMRNKYRTLIDYLMSQRPDVKVIHEDSTSIIVGCASAGGSTKFIIAQTFGTVTVQWKSSDIITGNHELEWQFEEFMDQTKMSEKMENDIVVYSTNLLSKFK